MKIMILFEVLKKKVLPISEGTTKLLLFSNNKLENFDKHMCCNFFKGKNDWCLPYKSSNIILKTILQNTKGTFQHLIGWFKLEL